MNIDKNNIFKGLLILFPIFLLSVKHFSNIVLIIIFIGSIGYLTNNIKANKYNCLIRKKIKLIVMITLAGNFLAVLISQMIRQEYYLPNYDGPLRMAMCVPIFLAISNGWLYQKGNERISILWFKYSFPLMILFTFMYRPSWTNKWGERITTYFVDPLSFGSIVLLATEITTVALVIFWDEISLFIKIAYVLIVFIGLYMVVFCGSRTGWLATPFIFYFWIKHYNNINIKAIRRNFITFTFVILSIILIYQSPGYVYKFQMIISEIIQYKFFEMNPDNSVTMRISFIRMGILYFIERPLEGWGDLGWMVIMNTPEISNYASEFTRNFAKNGFHNEILTSAVRSGIFGLLASIGYLLTPLYVAYLFYNIRADEIDREAMKINLLTVIIGLHFFINSFASEVTNLVFLASYITLTYTIMLGEILYETDIKNE